MANEITALRERAKELGINTFQMGKNAIADAIEKAEASEAPDTKNLPDDYDSGVEDEEDDAMLTGEDFPEESEETEATEASTPAAAPVDPAMVGYLAAQEYVKQMLANMPQAQAKPAVSDAEIAAMQARDKAAVDRDKKVMFGMEFGGGLGEPSYYTPCVNGKVVGIVVGKGKKLIPLSIAEVMERSIVQHRKNMKKQKEMARAAIEQGI